MTICKITKIECSNCCPCCGNRTEKIKTENEQLKDLLKEIRNNEKLLKPGIAGGQDQYAGLPPFVRLIDTLLKKFKD